MTYDKQFTYCLQEEYEYYDDDNDEESPAKDTEEDPRVIKELIELIRKAGKKSFYLRNLHI